MSAPWLFFAASYVLVLVERLLPAAICFAVFVVLAVCASRIGAGLPAHNPIPSPRDPNKQQLTVKQIARDCNRTKKWSGFALIPPAGAGA